MAEQLKGTGASGIKKKGIFLAIVLIVVAAGITARIVFHPKPKIHHVILNWHSAPQASGVTTVSYNVYRRAASGGTYTKIASRVTRLTYDDWIVNSGKTYFYVVTAVDQRGRESRYSVEVKAVIP